VNTDVEHWFDRFAESQTRGQLLKRVLAGAALTLPFVPSAAARAGGTGRSSGCTPGISPDPNACRKGCWYTAHFKSSQAQNRCTPASVGHKAISVGLLTAFFSQVALYEVLRYSICKETALLTLKSDLQTCLEPDCAGFNPCSAGGPCDTCPEICCPDPRSDSGYSCCGGPGACCKATGCGSGTTDCG